MIQPNQLNIPKLTCLDIEDKNFLIKQNEYLKNFTIYIKDKKLKTRTSIFSNEFAFQQLGKQPVENKIAIYDDLDETTINPLSVLCLNNKLLNNGIEIYYLDIYYSSMNKIPDPNNSTISNNCACISNKLYDGNILPYLFGYNNCIWKNNDDIQTLCFINDIKQLKLYNRTYVDSLEEGNLNQCAVDLLKNFSYYNYNINKNCNKSTIDIGGNKIKFKSSTIIDTNYQSKLESKYYYVTIKDKQILYYGYSSVEMGGNNYTSYLELNYYPQLFDKIKLDNKSKYNIDGKNLYICKSTNNDFMSFDSNPSIRNIIALAKNYKQINDFSQVKNDLKQLISRVFNWLPERIPIYPCITGYFYKLFYYNIIFINKNNSNNNKTNKTKPQIRDIQIIYDQNKLVIDDLIPSISTIKLSSAYGDLPVYYLKFTNDEPSLKKDDKWFQDNINTGLSKANSNKNFLTIQKNNNYNYKIGVLFNPNKIYSTRIPKTNSYELEIGNLKNHTNTISVLFRIIFTPCKIKNDQDIFENKFLVMYQFGENYYQVFTDENRKQPLFLKKIYKHTYQVSIEDLFQQMNEYVKTTLPIKIIFYMKKYYMKKYSII